MTVLVLVTIGSILAVIYIPKRISSMEMYTTSFFATFLASLADIYLDLKFDLYGFFDKGINWEYIVIFIVIYPAANILILNFFPYKKNIIKQITYILLCTIITLCCEYLSLHTEVFYYNGWKLWYSALCYPVIYTILVLNLHFIRKLNKIQSQ
ncbi:CBO0543 family protein [Metabacillus sediminilitoris]|uniref:CBO0543 family protein n=2 Tax=Metabacillus sediminilitoris TaxID=2567941 RepID=UPI0012D83D79|nr:CBO0543 family protein [Metabacillus sediminilitoris]QGQ46382.1 hypothetical protein GMB29_14845 [Metabacillus sediminilitoris]